MNRQNVTNWCREFSEGRTDDYDEQSSGRPSLIYDDLVQEIEGEIRANRRVTIRELNHIIPKVSNTTIHETVAEKLGHRKFCARWMPKILTDDHKMKWMRSALKFLTRYAQEGDAFPLVLRLKKHLAGKKFDDDDEVQEEVMTLLKGQAADFYDSGIQKLVPRLNKCLDNAGDYVEK